MTTAEKITFHYIKSPSFDEHPLHGVYGGITPHGVAMAVFAERMVIPKELDAKVVPVEGQPGVFALEEGEKRGKEGVVRSVHAVYHMDLAFAESLAKWLTDKVAEARQAGIK